jgi:hypothetical protein
MATAYSDWAMVETLLVRIGKRAAYAIGFG